MNRPADQRQEVIKFHVPLELRQVSRSPGAEHARTAGECKKFLHGLRKWDSVLQILFCQSDDLARPVMEMLVDHRFYNPVKRSHHIPLTIHLHRADLNNLKRQLRVLFFLFHRDTGSIPGQKSHSPLYCQSFILCRLSLL